MIKTSTISVGKKIKAFRKEKTYSQEQLAIKLGKSRTTISDYEQDIIDPPLAVLQELAEIFEKDIRDFFGNTDTEYTINREVEYDKALVFKEKNQLLKNEIEMLRLEIKFLKRELSDKERLINLQEKRNEDYEQRLKEIQKVYEEIKKRL